MLNQEKISTALQKLVPAEDTEESLYFPAFRKMADLLLNRATLYIGGSPYRLTEIEFYFKGGKHQDKFTHCNPLQKKFGHWYFHRFGNEYRSGTYKGLDIAFGNPNAHAGILIRGIESLEENPQQIDGPCMFVDHILEKTGHKTIADLVATFDISIDPPTSSSSPLYLALNAEDRKKEIYESPRVGLSLKKGTDELRQKFICKLYRFLTEPASIKKGKPHVILTLHQKGRSPKEISAITNTKISFVNKYIAAFEAGKSKSPLQFQKDLSTNDFCELFGACQKFAAPIAQN